MRPSLRQLRAFVAVVEEGSFTAAAVREGATQSGVSQHMKALETQLGVRLLDRDGRRMAATAAGLRYYEECVAALRRLDAAGAGLAAIERMGGSVRVGLMPTFTRAILAPALAAFLESSGGVEVTILEAYSGVLTDKVRAGELDFAIVPSFAVSSGLHARRIATNREMLVARAGRTGKHLAPVKLADYGPIDIVLPGPLNTRRQSIETYLASNGVDVRRRLALDAMIGTLEFVAGSDWVAILPAVLAAPDRDGARFEIRPLDDPPLRSDFVLIEPSRSVLKPAAKLFADLLTREALRVSALMPG
ncbi:MAG: LysR family transcriptional regulator [Hyphomicrobiales bacterium]|nr:LysR family transcriptional regulator [Hyphomicrobiales bacterium]